MHAAAGTLPALVPPLARRALYPPQAAMHSGTLQHIPMRCTPPTVHSCSRPEMTSADPGFTYRALPFAHFFTNGTAWA